MATSRTPMISLTMIHPLIMSSEEFERYWRDEGYEMLSKSRLKVLTHHST